jgi:hypothetical protein
MRNALIVLLLTCALSTSSRAEQPQPYAGMESRAIKALSDQQIADLRAGRGMGLALAAELNGYPGPSHLLELADQLQLGEDQRAAIQKLFNAMKAETIPIGEKIIVGEGELDRQFSMHTVTPASLESATYEIGTLQAQLRAAHLKFHLFTATLLTADQMQRYASLRGYMKGSDHNVTHH